jgi:hypothetical protein
LKKARSALIPGVWYQSRRSSGLESRFIDVTLIFDRIARLQLAVDRMHAQRERAQRKIFPSLRQIRLRTPIILHQPRALCPTDEARGEHQQSTQNIRQLLWPCKPGVLNGTWRNL